MADVKLAFKRDSLSDANSTTYSATKNVNGKSCTIFVNDRTKNGFGKDDYFYYNGDISLFSQKEIKELVNQGVDGKGYNANTVATPELGSAGILTDCKDMQEGQYYELGSVFDCADKASKDQTFVKSETKTDKPVAPKAETPEEAPKAEIPPPPVPEQSYDQQYSQPQWGQQPPVSYGPSPAMMFGAPIIAGGAIGGVIGGIFGGFKGFLGGLFGGAFGGMMGISGMGGGFGGFGGGFGGGGMDSTDVALNMAFANFFNSVSAPQSYPMLAMPMQTRPVSAKANLSELTDDNFDEAIKGETPVVVEFYSDSCRPCKEQSPILEQISQDYSGKVKVYQVNIDKAETQTIKYGVEATPTVIVFKDGHVINKFKGLTSKEELAAALNDAPSTVAAN